MSEVTNETEAPVKEVSKKIDVSRIADVMVELTIEVGNIKLSLEEISALKEGDILALNKHCDDPFDLKINNKKIAEGEIVQSDNDIFIKVTRIID